MRRTVHMVIPCGLTLWFATQATLSAGPGFGTIRKKTINLEARQPAVVRLADTSIAFSGKAANTEYQPVLQTLLATLQTEILSHEKSLVIKPDPKEAEWTLYLEVTGYSTPPPQKLTQRAGNETTVMDHWVGSLNVSYQVLDRRGRVHDADAISESYDKTYPEGAAKGGTSFLGGLPVIGKKKNNEQTIPHSAEDVKQALVHQAVGRIGAKLGNTTSVMEVRVAAGEEHLNRAAEFLDQRLWSRALDEIQSVMPFPNPQDESYRLYDLGLAFEAMSYEAKTYKDQRANLFQAQEQYDKALEMNRGEKYFVETVARLRDSIAHYRTLDQQQEKGAGTKVTSADRSVSSPAALTPAAAQGPAPAAIPTASGAKVNTVSDIIKLFKAGIPKEQILEVIKTSPLEFNPVDVDTLIAIKQSGLPVDIQNEMRQKVGAKPLASSAPAPSPKKTTPQAAAPAK